MSVRIQNLWTDVWGAITDNFGGVVNGIAGLWESTVNQIAKSLLYVYSLFDKSIDYQRRPSKWTPTRRNDDKPANKQDSPPAEREAIKQERIDAAAANKDAFSAEIEALKADLTASSKRFTRRRSAKG